MQNIDLISYINSSRIAGYVNSISLNYDVVVIDLEVKFLEGVISFLHNECKFESLIDIFGVDYIDQEKRFTIIYSLLSLHHNLRVNVKTKIDESTSVSGMSNIYNSACWYEREIYDMYGVRFEDNHNMTRILSDYNFKGHPMRKDFPLTGYVEVKYDLEKKKVVYEPVTLEQEFRNFDFLSPWEGAKYSDENKD